VDEEAIARAALQSQRNNNNVIHFIHNIPPIFRRWFRRSDKYAYRDINP
jgi:hypothetical protein